MDDNPYRSPEVVEAPAVGVVSGRREDLRDVARYQRAILVCILFYLIAAISWRYVADEAALFAAFVGVAAALVAVVYVFLLSTKIYSTGVGILLGILTLIPLFGLFVLLVINSKATGILKRNGIRVGFLGADPASV